MEGYRAESEGRGLEEGEPETFRPEMRRVEGYLVVVGMGSSRVGCEREGKSTGLAHPLPPHSCPLAPRPTGWQGVRRGGMLDSFEY